MKFCIIIPAYNEEENIIPAIEAIEQTIEKNKYNADVLIVNDGSTDKTQRYTDKIKRKFKNVFSVKHDVNQGYGAGVITGIDYSKSKKYDFVVFMECDLSADSSRLVLLVDKMKQGYDFVVGSRYAKGGKMLGVPFLRWVMSNTSAFFYRIAFRLPISDFNIGFRAIKSWLLPKMNLKEKKFHILLEEIYIARKFKAKFSEIPIVLQNRKKGKSKFTYDMESNMKYLNYLLKALFR